MKLSTTLVATATILTTSAHHIMIEPLVYNYVTPPLYQTWPLDESLTFPCQGRTQHIETLTKITAGTSQLVRFWTSAVHGGGSGQVAIAYHEHGTPPPSDVAAWKVIYSIIGGFPAQAVGNIPTLRKDEAGREDGEQCGDDEKKECVRQFEIPIPRGMRNGQATFAVTIINKIGNKEFYMSCSPVEISGGLDDDSFVDTLPALFVANFPGQCTAGESPRIVGFPEPGKYGKVYEQPTVGGQGDCAAAAVPVFEDAKSDAPSQTMTRSRETRPATSSATYQPSTSASSSISASNSLVYNSSWVNTPTRKPSASDASSTSAPVFQTTSATARPSTFSRSTTSPTSSVVTLSTEVRASSTVPSASSTGRPDWAAGMVPCQGDGVVVCLEAGKFGICNHGWTVPLALGADQICKDGRIMAKSGA